MTMRPALRPGAVLLRRDAHHLQIGTSPGYVLGDQPGLLSVIRLFDGMREMVHIAEIATRSIPEFSGDIGQVVRELMAAGLVLDARWWDFPADDRLRDEARARCLGGRMPGRISERGGYRISLHADPSCAELAEVTRDILRRSGFAPPRPDNPHLMILLSHGEPDRRRFESAMENGRDHLRVVVEEDRIRLGPMVVPGLTPCVNCHDLHRSDWDHAWPALMTQFGTHAAALSPPAIAATTTFAAATAIAAETIAHCEGTPAETSGHCLVIGPHHLERSLWPVSFHPACSCTLLIAA